MTNLTAPILAVVLSLLPSWWAAGAEDESTEAPDAAIKIVATVNGVRLTEYDVQETLKRRPHGEKLSEAATRTVLQTLVRDELLRQKALEFGLDADPAYRRKLAEAEAQLRAFQRESLRALYREHVRAQVAVTEAEALAYFEENADRIRTKLHVLQITRRDEPEQMARDEADLRGGAAFQEVASRRYSTLPQGAKPPWDLGYLHWSQIPEPWRDVVYALEPGQVSGIVQGPGGRSWILQLKAKTTDPSTTFETEKDRIVAALQQQKRDEAYDEQLRQLTERATVVLTE